MRRILYASVALLALTGPVFAQAGGGAAGGGAGGGQSNTNPKGTTGEPASGSNIAVPSPDQGTTTPHRRTHRHYAKHHRTPTAANPAMQSDNPEQRKSTNEQGGKDVQTEGK